LSSCGSGASGVYRETPAHGNAPDVLWSMRWYSDALALQESPFHTSPVFGPNGRYMGAFAHAPLLFLLLVPLHRMGELALACNCAAIPSLFAVFAFRALRRFRLRGHLHILWASSLPP
jgi:hypothetical protein